MNDPAASASDGSLPVLDVADLYDTAGDSRELAELMLRAFLGGAPAQLEEVGRALRSGDRVLVARAAHRLKGALAQISARVAVAAASALEHAAPVAEPDELGRLVDTLRAAFDAAANAATEELAATET